MKVTKEYTVKVSKGGRVTEFSGTLGHLINDVFGYTLECGQSYQHEKGNKKINTQPKTIKSLITNLNNAVNNSASNGWSDKHYSIDN